MRPLKIISGGQTGVDRAALDVAIELGIPHGGWCPKNRKAEDGPIPDRYLMTETLSHGYGVRTEMNIRHSDATLILSDSPDLTGGTALTRRLAGELSRACHVTWPSGSSREEIMDWLTRNPGIKTLNIAGPRESKCPGIYKAAKDFLLEVFA